jgi:5-methylcytosine-specific restriction enzyme subunit McrC
VGVQIDGLCIEILPKADHSSEDKKWQGVLIEMLRDYKKLKVDNVGHANVNNKTFICWIYYFEWYLNEVQLLIHQGLLSNIIRNE